MIMDRETYFTNKDTNGCSCYLAVSDKWNLVNLSSKFCVPHVPVIVLKIEKKK